MVFSLLYRHSNTFTMETCEMSCIKYLLFTFNALFVLSGIGLIVGGACVLRTEERFKTLLEASILAPPITLIVVGIIVFVVAFFGCCGAVKEAPGILNIFAGFLFVILASEITVGILAGMDKDAFFEELRKGMKASMDNFDPDITEDRRLWDDLQYLLVCCGFEGPDDWKMGGNYPASCCMGYDPTLHRDHLCLYREFAHELGCFQALRLEIIESSHIILGVAIGIGAVQITGIVLACMLSSAIHSERRKERHR